jgi:hypothetical protein
VEKIIEKLELILVRHFISFELPSPSLDAVLKQKRPEIFFTRVGLKVILLIAQSQQQQQQH